MICKQVFEKTTDKDTAINMLANKIPDINRAQSFKIEVKELLNLTSEMGEIYHQRTNELHKRLEEYLETQLGLPSDKVSSFIRTALCLFEQS